VGGGFPVVAAGARGSRIVDVDGHEYVDLCLVDTGAMGGHAPPALVEAVRAQVADGLTMMLPTERRRTPRRPTRGSSRSRPAPAAGP
jgi:glutamate-1-semialdehyde 2,1-aminomutase